MKVDKTRYAFEHARGRQQGYVSVTAVLSGPLNAFDFITIALKEHGRAKVRDQIVRNCHATLLGSQVKSPLVLEFLDGFAEGVLARYDEIAASYPAPSLDAAKASLALTRWIATAPLSGQLALAEADLNARKKPWRLVGFDTFEGEVYFLSGHDTELDCKRAAQDRLFELEREQPSDMSGGQDGIQDWVYIVTPTGSYDRYTKA